jgi:hypothetical protein
MLSGAFFYILERGGAYTVRPTNEQGAVNKYTMSGTNGKLLLAVNGFALAYAEKFTAVLNEFMKSFSFRGKTWESPEHYKAEIVLRHMSNPHPDIVSQVVSDVADKKHLDFQFKGCYTAKDGVNYPVTLYRLIPVNGDLDDYLDGT